MGNSKKEVLSKINQLLAIVTGWTPDDTTVMSDLLSDDDVFAVTAGGGLVAMTERLDFGAMNHSVFDVSSRETIAHKALVSQGWTPPEPWTRTDDTPPKEAGPFYWVVGGAAGSKPVIARLNVYMNLWGSPNMWQAFADGTDFEMSGTQYRALPTPPPPAEV